MKKKDKKKIRTIGLNLLVILVVGVILGYVMINYNDVIFIFGVVPLAIQQVIIWGLFFLLGYFLLRNRGD